MNLQDKLISLSKYNIGFKTHDDKFLVSICYKEGWTAIKPSDESIQFMVSEKAKNTYYYAVLIEEDTTHLQNIFNTIEETITYNIELEEKVTLFQKKVEELQAIFAERPLSELIGMQFTFKAASKSRKAKKQPTKDGPKEEPKKTEPVIEDLTKVNDIDKKVSEIIKKKGKQRTA